MSFVDTFSRYTWLYLLKTKFEVFTTFINFKTIVEKQLNKPIKKVQTDWRGEFRSLTNFFNFMVSFINYDVHTLINKTEWQSANTVMLSKPA